MEEIRLEMDYKSYGLEEVRFTRSRDNSYKLEVPGLLEKRPSILVEDVIKVRNTSNGHFFKGIVTRVNESTIEIRFNDDFDDEFRASKIYNINFTFNRMQLRLFHQALEIIGNGACHPLIANWLFPKRSTFQLQDALVPFTSSFSALTIID